MSLTPRAYGTANAMALLMADGGHQPRMRPRARCDRSATVAACPRSAAMPTTIRDTARTRHTRGPVESPGAAGRRRETFAHVIAGAPPGPPSYECVAPPSELLGRERERIAAPSSAPAGTGGRRAIRDCSSSVSLG